MVKMGRPRSFDRNEAIDQAMLLFWEHGYESTSLTQLKAAIGGGISAPSFYAAFASKEALFKEVVARYIETHGQVVASLWDETLPPREAIEQALRRSARMQAKHSLGCLLVVSAGTCAPENTHIQQMLASVRARTQAGITACIQRGIAAGHLPDDTDPLSLSIVFDGFLMGLSTLSRDGMPLATLEAAITQLMTLWDACAAAGKGSI